MSSNEEYLDSLLKTMSDDEGAKPESSTDSAMSAEEIEAMFAAAERVANGEEPVEEESVEEEPAEEEPAAEDAQHSGTAESDGYGNDDLLSLLGSLQDDSDLNEIHTLLQKAENNEAVDESVYPAPDPGPDGEAADAQDTEGEMAFEDVGWDAGWNEETPAQEPADEAVSRKKKGFFARLFSRRQEAQEADALDENQAIMQALEAEDKAEARKKKKRKKGKMPSGEAADYTEESTEGVEEAAVSESIPKEAAEPVKQKKKKWKKGKPPKEDTDGIEQEAQEVSEEEEPGKEKSKKEKSKKEKAKKEKPKKEKTKKEKPQKAPKPKKEESSGEGISDAEEKPSRKISKKSIVVVILFAATVLALVLFMATFLSDMIRTNHAKEAFDRQDYMTYYEDMYGRNLSEQEREMFEHAQTVLGMQRRMTVYERYLNEGKELEALDVLMQAAADYEEVHARAQACGASGEVAAIFDRIWQILSDNYGLTEEEARAIALCESDVDYTRYLTSLVEGGGIAGDGGGTIALPEAELQDVLPAEEELIQPNFAD